MHDPDRRTLMRAAALGALTAVAWPRLARAGAGHDDAGEGVAFRCGLRGYVRPGAAAERAPLVLLHGYGSAPEEWFQFTTTIHPPDDGGFVFPRGPEETRPPDGPAGKRGWWRLRLYSYVPKGATLPDMSRARPPGLGRATAKIADLLHELEQTSHVPPQKVMLGGFSQGAMVAANVAFTRPTPLRALIMLSGTPVDEARWKRGLHARRGLPVFLAHGRNDQILPFAGSEHLRDLLTSAGLAVTFVPFDGGHEIPMPVIEKLNEFLAALR